MRIEPVRRKPDRSEIECRAENGAGDPVFAQASLTIFDGEFFTRSFVMPVQCAEWILNKLQNISVRPCFRESRYNLQEFLVEDDRIHQLGIKVDLA